MTDRVVVLEITRMEASHLTQLVMQFADLLDDPGDRAPDDPALARLVPDAYSDNPAAAREFRSLTQRELLDRRSTDAAAVLASLHGAADLGDRSDDESALTEVELIRLDRDAADAWLRTLAALRLVLASRLGIADEDDHHDDDPRFGIYEWLGYRLDGLVRVLGEGS